MDSTHRTSGEWFEKALAYEQAGNLQAANLALKQAVAREAVERAG